MRSLLPRSGAGSRQLDELLPTRDFGQRKLISPEV